MSPRAKLTFRRHVPPATVPVLKNFAFELMTRSAFVPRLPAVPEQSAIHGDARWIWKSAALLRSGVRPNTAITPAPRPGHGVGTALGAAPGHHGTPAGAPPLRPLPLHFGRRCWRTGFVARLAAEDLEPFRLFEQMLHDNAIERHAPQVR